jgi:PAS domain S-box-containing protein
MQVLPLTLPGAGAVVAHYNITARKKAELQVATQNHQLQLALSAARLGMWSLDVKTGRIECSEEASRILGRTERSGDVEEWSRMIHPEDLETTSATFRRSVARGLPFFAEFRVAYPDEQIRWLASLARVERGADGEVLAVVGTVEDISERKRTERTLLSYNRILELIATSANLQRTLEEVVHLVEEFLPRSLCSVLVVDPSAQRLRFGAGPSLPEEYNRAVDGVTISPKAGSCGTAAYRRETVVVEDIETDPLWDDYRALAARHGLRSCVSVPILAGGNAPGTTRGAVLGTFALYGRQPGPVVSPALSILSEAGLLAREVLEAMDVRATDRRGSSRPASPRLPTWPGWRSSASWPSRRRTRARSGSAASSTPCLARST